MILDTNAYSALANGDLELARMVKSASDIKLPLPVIAELKYGFNKGSQKAKNLATLQKFLSQPQVSILIPSYETTDHYARLQLLCKNQGKALSHNDLWIAGLAFESGDKLVTYDKDFTVLQEVFGDKLVMLS